MMKFFKDQKFQAILATPPAKMEIIGEYVDDIFVVYREGYNSFTGYEDAVAKLDEILK